MFGNLNRSQSPPRAIVGQRLLAALLLGVTALWSVQAAERRASLHAALESITAAELKAHVDFLADDQREGRASGTRGGREAGDYLAEKLAALGLRPAGIDGGYFQPFGHGYRNVLAWIPGSDEKLRGELIVVSAHYDHVGYGNRKNSRGPTGQIHNGADDNASGTAGLLEVAGALAMLPEAPKRTVLVAFWDAEEMGMLGSQHWLDQPTLRNYQVKAMLCMDMIGRLRGEKLKVFGTRCGYGLRRLIAEENDSLGLEVDYDWTMRRNSDHYVFFEKRIPALLFHTGVHDDYHTPRDDAHLINHRGMNRVARLVFRTTWRLAEAGAVTAFREAGSRESADTQRRIIERAPALPSRLGVSWSPQGFVGPGVRVTEVTEGSPADKAGIRANDRIMEFGGREVASGTALLGAVMLAPSPASVEVMRPGEENPLKLQVELDGEPMRIGLLWRIDDAEPGVTIVRYVVPGSPAALAGLKPGDRIYRVVGRDFGGEDEFRRLLTESPGPIELRVERDGRLRGVELELGAEPKRRAA